MSKIEGLLLWPAMFGYTAVFIMYLIVTVFKKDRFENRAWGVFIISFIFQTASIAWRWYVSGRIPVMVSYEHYQLGSWFVALSTILGGIFYRKMRIVSMGSTLVI
jgi:ABC-type transport system involved in cytochrome c biogenesis permease subunit